MIGLVLGLTKQYLGIPTLTLYCVNSILRRFLYITQDGFPSSTDS